MTAHGSDIVSIPYALRSYINYCSHLSDSKRLRLTSLRYYSSHFSVLILHGLNRAAVE